jgi:hypothetical protein
VKICYQNIALRRSSPLVDDLDTLESLRCRSTIAKLRDESLCVMGSTWTDPVSTPVSRRGRETCTLFPIPLPDKGRDYTLYSFTDAHYAHPLE